MLGCADEMEMLRLVGAMNSDLVRVLGPVEARAASGWVTAPPQQRLLLALLALRVGQVIPVGELVDAIWPEAPPASARASIQVMVTRLRQILADLPGGIVERRGDGYRLAIAPDSIDVQQFRALAQAARDAPNAIEAVGAFDQALALWRGPALADVPANARVEAIRFALAEERLSAAQDRISAMLDIGRDRQAAEELTGLMAAHPLAERLAGLRMAALYRCGRQADALKVFRDLRERLSSELAIEPGRELQSLHQQILTGDLAISAATGWPIRPEEVSRQQLVATAGDTHSEPRQLPTGVAQFTGRAVELRVLDSLLGSMASADGTVAISAISGMAGVGKTSLALHWARDVAHRFPDGQLYVNLRAFGPWRRPVRAADALRGFLDALDVPQGRNPADTDAQAALYRTVLASKRMLVMLDNAADEDQVRPLLPGADGCLVLITSRRRLAGLAACEGATLLTLDVMSQPEAVALLAGRLGAELTEVAPETANELATLCGRLPLALSIAAARAMATPNLDLAELTTQMQDLGGRLDMLDVGEPASSVRAVFSWSYRDLSRPAARMFRLLAVHPGPDIGLAAAASLVGCPAVQARRILAELVSAHLMTEHVPGRWIFHDLLRAYASEQARCEENQAEHDAAILRVLDYYLQTACFAAVMLRPGRDPALALLAPPVGAEPDSINSPTEAIAWYDAEHRVLAEVISWAAAAGFDAHAWRLRWALADYLAMTGRWRAQAVTMRTGFDAALAAGDVAGQALSSPRPRLRSVSARPWEPH
jgi:DNA-binding SARP family transcriptional activator